MPYDNRSDLPDQVKDTLSNVPHAQDIYKEAFNSALEEYNDESRTHATAWAAVKKKYQKDEATGDWHPKES